MTDFERLPSMEQLSRLHQLALDALRYWDLDVIKVTPIKVRENAVFRLDMRDGSRAVLRVHRARYHTDDELNSEFIWMAALADSGVEVPRVIATRSGRPFAVVPSAGVPEPRQVDVFEWVTGQQLGTVEQGVIGDRGPIVAQYRTLGQLAGKIHNQAVKWTPPLGFTRHSWDVAGLLGEQPLWGRFWELEALSPAERGLMQRTRAKLLEDLSDYGTSSERFSLIHADLVAENLLVDGSHVRVIDFDDTGYGWHLFELATSLYFVRHESHFSAAEAAVFDGYRTIRHLADDVIAEMAMFYAVRGTTYLGWVHTRHGSDTARELTPFLIELACEAANEYLARRRVT